MICAACGATTATDPCASCGSCALLDGRWRLDAVLGRGAHGTTWRATRRADGVVVALKELRVSSGKARELLEREARVLAQLDHDALPRFVERFEVASGRHRAVCLATEWVPGEDLQAEMAHRRYTPADVVDVIEALASVLVWLHALTPPVVHRDLKPANVLRRPDGRLVLVDFGAVRDALVDPDVGGSTVAGTFGYMAPEQFAGDVSPATDLYGLGALAVALLTRKDPATLAGPDHRVDWAPHVALPPALSGLVGRLLSPHASDRPTAKEVLALVPQVRARLHEAPPPPPSRRPSRAWVALGAVPAVLAAMWFAKRGPSGDIETDAFAVQARDEVLYTAAGWLGECVRDHATPTGTNEIQAHMGLAPTGAVEDVEFHVLYGGDAIEACVGEVLRGLVFSPPKLSPAGLWFTWTWESLAVGPTERADEYALRARTEVVAPAEPRLRACVDRYLPDPPNINFVHVHMVIGDDGIAGETAVHAVHSNDALRECLFAELEPMRFAGPGTVWFRLVYR